MSINYLIDKYGQDGLLDEGVFRFRIVKDIYSPYKRKYTELTGLNFLTIITKDDLELTDKVIINKIEYCIYKINAVSKKYGSDVLYYKVELFENDFIHEATIKQATLEGVHTNPAQERETILERVFLRIKQVKPEDSLSMLFYGSRKATHVITLKHIEGVEDIKEGCIVKTANKVFEVLNVLDISNDTLLLMYCEEVIYGK